jgi:hypothetical protein
MIEAEALAELKREHGDVYVIELDGECVAVRRPKRAEVRRWQDGTAHEDKRKRFAATEQLVRDSLVWPTLPEFEAMVDNRPLLPMTIGGEVLKIAGMVESAEAKKA